MWHVREIRKGAYRVFMKRPGGKRPLEVPRHRSENIINVDLQEVG
jgi:hypothetical protein